MSADNNFDQCLKCTICTAYCPVLAVNPEFPGPKRGGPDQERLRLKNADYFEASLKYCLNCKRCEVSCPSGVRVGDIIQKARIKNEGMPKLRDAMLANTDLMGSMSTMVAPIVNATIGLPPVKFILDAVMKIDKRRTFPKYSFGTFRSWFKRQEKKQLQFDKQISYFHGCYVNYNNPQLGKDFVKVMNALGYGVVPLEKEKCCGVALIANGLIKQAKSNAKKNLISIRKSVAEKRKVVSTSSTCAFTIRDEYNHLLEFDNADIRDSFETATRFVFNILEKEGVEKLKFKNKKLKIAYHTPCHMEKLGWSNFSIGLLRMIPNVEVVVLGSNCCGISGTYGFKKENYEYSQKIGAPLFKEIESGDFDFVASDCETCKWQIEMSTSKLCHHPISVLADMLED